MPNARRLLVAGLAVGVYLGAAAPAPAENLVPAGGDISACAAPAMPEPHYTADPGSALSRAVGRYDAAELFLKRSIAIDQKIHGCDHPGLAALLGRLAALYQAAGRYREAEPLLQRAFSIDAKALGREHPELAGRLNNLAVLYWATGRPDAAAPLFVRALTIFEKRLPPGHPVLTAIRENYVDLLAQLDQSREGPQATDSVHGIRHRREVPPSSRRWAIAGQELPARGRR